MVAMSNKEVERFSNFPRERGAEMMAPTNPFEVLRFRANGKTGLIYRNAQGLVSSMNPEATQAWRAWKDGSPWRGAGQEERTRRKSVHEKALLARDGSDCFFCGKPLGDDVTLEHMCARTAGGPNHVANLVLAHFNCNQAAGNMSVAEKVLLRERMRAGLPIEPAKQEETV